MNKKIEISVVIPVYGCRNSVIELYERLTKTITQITDSYEIIMVDDKCPQNSWEIIEKLCKKDENVVGISLSRNFGQMKAILAGLDASVGEWTVVMDCDLQDSPEEILNLYKKAQEGYDIVYSRRNERQDGVIKKLISKIFYKLYSWMTEDCYDPAMNNFCICNRKVVESFCSIREYHRAFTMYLKWLGYDTTIINVNHNKRKEGKSSYSMKKRIRLALDILMSQSDKVLKLIVKSGLLIAFVSVIVAIITIVRYFFYDITAGWSSIIVAICIFGGLTIASVGCVGTYVGKIFVQSKNRPLYVVNQIVNKKQSGK